MYKSCDHTFAICAYKESQYLEECIKSVKNQTVNTETLDKLCGIVALLSFLPLCRGYSKAGRET